MSLPSPYEESVDIILNINEKLPKEILLRIMSFLDVVSLCRCAQVCKEWNAIALDGSVWRRVDLHGYEDLKETSRCLHVETKSDQTLFMVRRGQQIMYKKPGVNYDIQDWVVESLSYRSGLHLNTLCLHHCQNITDQSMVILAKECRNVEILTLSCCKKITDRTFDLVGEHCHRLRKLDIGRCSLVTDRAMRAISTGCPELELINISRCNISDEGISALCSGCHKISVFICKDLQLSGTGIKQLAANCPNLKVLNADKCRGLNDGTVLALERHCLRLKFLHLSYTQITDRAMFSLGDFCVDLKALEVEGCKHLRDDGVCYLTQRCKKLQRLNLTGCTWITDATLKHLSIHLLYLSDLALSCTRITDLGLEAIKDSANFKQTLRVLELDFCRHVTENGLQHLFCYSALRCLTVAYSSNKITKNGTQQLQERLPNLCVHAYSSRRFDRNILYMPGAAQAAARTNQTQEGGSRCCIA